MSNQPSLECCTCRYSIEIPGSMRHSPHGILMYSCHRYPPQVSNNADWRFPEMHPLDWCGEWEEKE